MALPRSSIGRIIIFLPVLFFALSLAAIRTYADTGAWLALAVAVLAAGVCVAIVGGVIIRHYPIDGANPGNPA